MARRERIFARRAKARRTDTDEAPGDDYARRTDTGKPINEGRRTDTGEAPGDDYARRTDTGKPINEARRTVFD